MLSCESNVEAFLASNLIHHTKSFCLGSFASDENRKRLDSLDSRELYRKTGTLSSRISKGTRQSTQHASTLCLYTCFSSNSHFPAWHVSLRTLQAVAWMLLTFYGKQQHTSWLWSADNVWDDDIRVEFWAGSVKLHVKSQKAIEWVRMTETCNRKHWRFGRKPFVAYEETARVFSAFYPKIRQFPDPFSFFQ